MHGVPPLRPKRGEKADGKLAEKRREERQSSMKLIATIALVITLAPLALAHKKNPLISIQVVDSKSSVREWLYDVPGYINTTCWGNTCWTTYNYPSTGEIDINQVHVFATMPGGQHIVLWCQAGWRHCYNLAPGAYRAELQGNTVWLFSYDLDGRTVHRTKYRYATNW